jgi:hypothetical protein
MQSEAKDNGRIPIIYIAGPLTATLPNSNLINFSTVQHNIDTAKAAGYIVAQLGGMVLIPHTNTGCFFGPVDSMETFWRAGYLEFVRRSDAIVTTPDWQYSDGAQKEVRLAKDRGMAIFHNVVSVDCGPAQALRDWISGYKGER